ncbi:MAG TPA: type VII secretion protein EccE [Micromonosporaceae bacterium]|nr:type VII secretion protein EccE [Micromonosporaceae bacterium]
MNPLQARAIPAARPDTEAPATTGPVFLLPRRRPGHLGPVNVVQLLVAEVAIVAVLAVLKLGVAVVLGTIVAGLAVLVATWARGDGRWWLERQLMRRHHRQRRQAAPPVRDTDARLTALRWLAPGLSVQNVIAADSSQVGVARDDAGWFAVAALTPTGLLRAGPTGQLRLDAVVAALAEASQPGAAVQLVIHTVPAPSLGIDPAAPAAQSYRQLLAGFGADPVPMDRAMWLAVRLDLHALAEAGAGPDTDVEPAPAVTAALIRRVGKALRGIGVPYHVLDSDRLLDALVRGCDLPPAAGAGGSEAPREDWSGWQSPYLAHRSYWVRGWPALGRTAALLSWLTTVPAASTSVALTLTPEGDTVDLRCLFRVAAPARELAQVCHAVTRQARQEGADLFPLDGEQGPAVYASAPTGGGPR